MNDEAIIALFWERSESAIAQAEQKFRPLCQSIAYRILANQEDAEECVNDALLAAWKAIPPERPRRLAAFLGRITRNIALDRFDYYTAEKRSRGFETLLSELEDCIPTPEEVESKLESGEILGIINRFLRSCNRESRNIFLRRYWFCDSVEEISARFGISQSKVKSSLFRTRNGLRKQLTEMEVIR